MMNESTPNREQYLIDKAIQPFVGNRPVCQLFTLGIYAEPSFAAGDGKHAGKLHGPPDDKLDGKQCETCPGKNGTYSEYGKRYECVCLVGAQYLVVLSAYHIPLPESAEQKDWWKDEVYKVVWYRG